MQCGLWNTLPRGGVGVEYIYVKAELAQKIPLDKNHVQKQTGLLSGLERVSCPLAYMEVVTIWTGKLLVSVLYSYRDNWQSCHKSQVRAGLN